MSGPLDRIAHPVYSRGGQNFTTFDGIEKSYKKLYMVVFFNPVHQIERISFQENENLQKNFFHLAWCRVSGYNINHLEHYQQTLKAVHSSTKDKSEILQT